MAKKKLSLAEQAKQILEQAEQRGLSNNYLFKTTFDRYQMQLQILNDLEGAIQEYGATVTKEYVRGRQNLTANPAITEYNRTTTAANGTVATLLNILKAPVNDKPEADSLSDFLKDG